MAASTVTALNSLPVQSNPGYAVKVSLDRIIHAVSKAEKVLSPSFFRRLLGGTSSDHARAVVAASIEEAKALRGVLSASRKAAVGRSDGSALIGSVDRIVNVLDQWRDAAIEFEEAIYGSDEKLLRITRKLLTLCGDLKNPASGIA